MLKSLLRTCTPRNAIFHPVQVRGKQVMLAAHIIASA
jgi:hypothetical protein